MKIIYQYAYLIISCYFIIISCSSNTEPTKPDIEYPTILYTIGRIKADSIQNSFNTSEIKISIDDYGLFSFTDFFERGNSNITDKSIAVKLAKESLLKYSKYSNITDTSTIELKDAVKNDISLTGFSDWIISFKNQKKDDIEVLHSEINVIVHDQVKRIIGHHFNDISIPKLNIFSKEKIQEKIVGHKFEAGGKGSSEVIITSDMIIKNKISKNIIWIELNDSIELHVVWNIPLGYCSEIIRWNFYLDILSGEILSYSKN